MWGGVRVSDGTGGVWLVGCFGAYVDGVMGVRGWSAEGAWGFFFVGFPIY